MKSQGFSQTPQDIMEEYNGCSVPQYTRYPTMSISRMGVQRVATSFPADMASNMPDMRNELKPRC